MTAYGVVCVLFWVLVVLPACLLPIWLRQQDERAAEETMRQWLGIDEGEEP